MFLTKELFSSLKKNLQVAKILQSLNMSAFWFSGSKKHTHRCAHTHILSSSYQPHTEVQIMMTKALLNQSTTKDQ